MAHETLKTLITNNIKTNGQNAITAQILQNVLIAMVDEYPDISGYATRTWVQQQDDALKEWVENKHYATQTWTNQQLENYLPLTGGNIDGILFVNETMNIGGSFIEWNDNGDYSRILFDQDGIILTTHGSGYIIANEFIKRDGTSAQFLKADGSVDDNAYLPVVNGVVSVSAGYMDIYSAGQMGGMATIFEAKDNQDVIFMGSPSYFFSGEVHASAFIRDNGTSDEVLCADGSVKTLAQLKAALNAV